MRTPLVPTALERDVVRGSQAIRAGVLTANQLRGRAWRRLHPDVYLHRDVPVTHLERVRAACLLVPASVVTGRSAAQVWGVDLATTEDDVEVTVPPGTHQRRVPGLVLRRAGLPDHHRWQRLGLPVTTAGARAVRLGGLLPPVEAVVAGPVAPRGQPAPAPRRAARHHGGRVLRGTGGLRVARPEDLRRPRELVGRVARALSAR